MNKTVNSNSKELLPIVNVSERCETDIRGRIVCANATCVVLNTEAFNKELKVSLLTTFRTVTLDDDGEYDLTVNKSESTVSITSENVNPSVKSAVFADVTACSCTDKGTATAEIEISGWVLKENKVNFIDEKENVIFRTEKHTVENVACLEEYKLTLTNNGEARLPLKKILDFSTAITVNSVYPSAGSFQIDGDLVSRLVAVSDSGIVVAQTFVNPFSTEINSDCVTAESAVDVYARTVKSNVTVTEADARIFVFETDVKILYAVSEKVEIDAITDCYSKTRDLSVTECVNVINTSSCYRSVRDKATSYVKSENILEEILCVNAPFVSAVNATVEDTLKIEGLITATLIYCDEDGIKSVPCEIPFSSVAATDFDCTETFFPEVKILNIGARIRSATEVEVIAEICISVRGTNRHDLKLLSDIEEGAEKVDSEYAISLYIVKPGETVWDVAKALNTDEETVFRLNPELSLPLKGGEKVLIYNELVYLM